MRVVITGITGFAGGYLAELLSKKKGIELFGLRRPGSKKKAPYGARLEPCDVRDTKSLDTALKKIRPERIFHLAASASVGQSWTDPKGTFDNNVRGTEMLFEAVLRHCPEARIHVAGSGEVYGRSSKGARLKETDPLQPRNPYAESKLAQENIALRYHAHHGMRVVCTRAFNHIGPRQDPGYVAGDFARQVALIEAGKKKPVMEVGDLTAVRDFTDVRDVVRAYWLCLADGEPGEVYNVASGRAHRASDLLDSYLKQSAVKITVKKKKALFRKRDAPVLVGDATKLRKRTGWKPAIPFERTLKDVLAYWRHEVRRGF